MEKSKSLLDELTRISFPNMKLSDYDKSRNDLLKMFINVQTSNVTNNEKISFVTKSVKLMVNTFIQANNADGVPQKDIEQIFGIRGDTEIKDHKNIPVDRAIIGVWKVLISSENGIN